MGQQVQSLPLHLHLMRIYLPGMAGDRQVCNADVQQELILDKSREQFTINNGSTLYCEAPLPNFWKETLYRCGLLKEEDILERMQPPQKPRIFEINKTDTVEIAMNNLEYGRYKHKSVNGKILIKVPQKGQQIRKS